MDYKLYDYQGCYDCPLKNSNCSQHKTNIEVTFTKAQKTDDCMGGVATVFCKDDTVIADARIKDNTIYCITAQSPIYEEYHDYIMLDNIEVRPINI